MAVRTEGNTIPEAIALFGPQDVMYVKEATIAPSGSASFMLALSLCPPQHGSPNALITPDTRPYVFYHTRPVTPKE
jgi:hypothetical protein